MGRALRWPFVLLAVPLLALMFYVPADVAVPYLKNSVPYVGAGVPAGSDIIVAVIDTGINYNHPDLYGFGGDGKVVGGHNFVSPHLPPVDRNGHGTQVAGIIAANGDLRGVAPGVKLLSYKVSENGEGVQPDLIVQAIRMAVQDGADIINISLGVNKTNERIDTAVTDAVRQGVLVVAAAGNDGPTPSSIGSPGHNPAALTVGATYNNLTMSRVATLEVNGIPYTVVPMADSPVPLDVVNAPLIHAGYGRSAELEGVSDYIVLVERGSDTPGELLYFSIKEHNAAEAGAVAIIVFNNERGMFYGELVHDFIDKEYKPRIPAVSMSQEDGMAILDVLYGGEAAANLRFSNNPDHTVQFSSRGPAWPSYVKPDLVAPGAYINTTALSGYTIASGTSYAAPHVSGAAALLMERYPGISSEDIRSMLATTARPVVDVAGDMAPLDDAGSGRLDVGAALHSGVVLSPPVVIAGVSAERPVHTSHITLRDMVPGGHTTIYADTPDTMSISYGMADSVIGLNVSAISDSIGRLIIQHDDINHTIPVVAYSTAGTVRAIQDDGRITFDVYHPDGWSFAKIAISKRDGPTHEVSVTPDRPASVLLYEPGLYHVTADIVGRTSSTPAYDTIQVDSPHPGEPTTQWDWPWRQTAIAGTIAGIIGAAGVMRGGLPRLYRRRHL